MAEKDFEVVSIQSTGNVGCDFETEKRLTADTLGVVVSRAAFGQSWNLKGGMILRRQHINFDIGTRERNG